MTNKIWVKKFSTPKPAPIQPATGTRVIEFKIPKTVNAPRPNKPVGQRAVAIRQDDKRASSTG